MRLAVEATEMTAKIEYMLGMDFRWRIFKELPKCPTCGHEPGMMIRVGPYEGHSSQEEADEWWRDHGESS